MMVFCAREFRRHEFFFFSS